MPFDGVTVRALALELENRILDSRIERISMPSGDEVVIIIRSHNGTQRLYISMNPSYPSVFLTDEAMANPPVPPNFCMFLRKHIGGGIIKNITHYGFERYFSIEIDSRTSLGDIRRKTLMIELTGKNCNLVLIDESGVILDSLRHIDASMSSVREVMPARQYKFIPSQGKTSPNKADPDTVMENEDLPVGKMLLSVLTGFSPVLCREVCHRASWDPEKPISMMPSDKRIEFSNTLKSMLLDISENITSPCTATDTSGSRRDFHCVALHVYGDLHFFDNLNDAVEAYFLNKRKKEKSDLGKSDLVKAVSRNMERCRRKIALHAAIVEKEKNAGELQLFGELITANIHMIAPGSDEIDLLNYYTGEFVKVSLDPNRTAPENAQKYYKKFKKTKNAVENSKTQLKEAQNELSYLESVSHWLGSAETPEDTKDIRRELAAQDYIKKKHTKYKKKDDTPGFRPHRYISSEGYEILAGRNNFENDRLTFKVANSRDLWLHAKGTPGSHVIVRKKDRSMDFFPDRTISEAAVIAVYHSKARNSGQTAVDYSEVRNIKKPGGAKPGMVNYFEYFSAYATPDDELVRKLTAE